MDKVVGVMDAAAGNTRKDIYAWIQLNFLRVGSV